MIKYIIKANTLDALPLYFCTSVLFSPVLLGTFDMLQSSWDF